MKGDFSNIVFRSEDNYTGVLHQQGRALLDRDGTDSTLIQNRLRRGLAADAIGARVAAVPAAARDSFKVGKAQGEGSGAKIEIAPGRIWVDGLPFRLPGDAPVSFAAQSYGPPMQVSPGPTALTAGHREAVILELWEEAFSAFQQPATLLEPALGGPDTTERVKVFMALRLLRLKADEQCEDVAQRLDEDVKSRGRLTVDLARATVITGDCPMPLGGGYTGFEHFLYRIEIDEPTSGGLPRFKWSRFNGGLVGRGAYDGADTVTITANDQMIRHCGLKTFYFEVLAFDAVRGHWRVFLSADAALGSRDQQSELKLQNLRGAWPTTLAGANADKSLFFRLWDGAGNVSDHSTALAEPKELEQGIRIALTQPGPGVMYRPGDYWTFAVRASGTDFDSALLPRDQAPHGIRYHRAPLAILEWSGRSRLPIRAHVNQIEDCRVVFEPLTGLSKGCCIDVEPGEDLHRALAKVKKAGGGCICLLPGVHVLTRPLELAGLAGIHIRGFGFVSRLYVPNLPAGKAAIDLTNAHDIQFESFLAILAPQSSMWACSGTTRLTIRNVAVLLDPAHQGARVLDITKPVEDVRLEDNLFAAPSGIAGGILSRSEIVNNVWLGTMRGISVDYLRRSRISGNVFAGFSIVGAREIAKRIYEAVNSDPARRLSPVDIIRGTLPAQRVTPAPNYVAIEATWAAEGEFRDNEILAGTGMRIELAEHCAVENNAFLTRIAGVECGWIRGLAFRDNRIGARSGDNAGREPSPCETGVIVLGDAADCQIVRNDFANVKQGVLFETDLDGKKAVIRDFTANRSPSPALSRAPVEAILRTSLARIDAIRKKPVFLTHAFFQVGECEGIVIEGNRFDASETAIEWSGMKRILDFQIVDNRIAGCQGAAILIEPDDRIAFLADPVETKGRLIGQNRFDVHACAVRATIGAVRVEQNDIRVRDLPLSLVPPAKVLTVSGGQVYKTMPAFASAVKGEDYSMLRMIAPAAKVMLAENTAAVSATALSQALTDTILNEHASGKGDQWADKAATLKDFADLKATGYLPALMDAWLDHVNANAEGFAINLGGIQNRVVHNRLLGERAAHPGGILFHAVSGEVRDNDVVVPGTALLMNGALGLSSAYKGAEIVGNTLSARGVAGSKFAVYAISIPSLSAGNLFVLGNVFNGTVMIGGDPIAGLGYAKPSTSKLPGFIAMLHPLKLEPGNYAANLALTFSGETKSGMVSVKPPTAVMPVWESDPHAGRPVIQFCNNRVIAGWVGIFERLSSANWSKEQRAKQAGRALVAQVGSNILDYGGIVAGHELVIVGNHSQLSIRYQAGSGRDPGIAGNVPPADAF